ncbi:MAG: hypothetical protein GX760_03545 [Erysipelothrix sp.]|nr:hypothetical protein [Erysipelothrix sp.]
MKNNRKTVGISLIFIIALIATYFIVKPLLNPADNDSDKTISIEIYDVEQSLIYSEKHETNVNTLGLLLDEMNSETEMFSLDGDASSEFGRYLSAIDAIELPANSFWVYESDNNKMCLSEAYCPGIDYLAIEDEDVFVFKVLLP